MAGVAEHPCLVCRCQQIPIYRAFCVHCFPLVPWKLRAEVIYAWRFRAAARPALDEVFIELQQWVREYGKDIPR